MSPHDPKTSDVAAAIDFAKEMLGAEFPAGQILDHPAVLVPNGMEIKSLKWLHREFAGRPERRAGTAKAGDLASFVAIANRFKDEGSAIYATPPLIRDGKVAAKPAMSCVFDYHEAGPDAAEQKARFGGHRATYDFPLDESWETWLGKNREAMSQHDFAEFVDNRIADIDEALGFEEAAERWPELAPVFREGIASPSKMLELARGIGVRENARVKQAIRLQSGEAQILFESEHVGDDGAPIRVPAVFFVTPRIFYMGAPYRIPARLRYRISSGKLFWYYDLYRPERAFDDAFREATAKAQAETGLPLYLGSDEGKQS